MILAAVVALLYLGVGAASALQPGPPPGGGLHQGAGAGVPTIELIPAVSATIVAPAPGVAIELIPAVSATLASSLVGSHVLPAAAHLSQNPAAAGDSGASSLPTTTIHEGSVSIELIPATSSELAPTTRTAHADSSAALPIGAHPSGAQSTDRPAGNGAVRTTGAESISVLAEASSLDSAAAATPASPHRALPWIVGVSVVVLLGGAALIVARTRRPVRH